MKYINHMTCAFHDDKIQAAVAMGGHKVYAAYWIIVEAIAAQIRPESISTELTLTWTQWGARLLMDPRTARSSTAILHNVSVIVLQDHGKSATIKVPNILKYADEYTRKVIQKSGQTPDTSRDKVPRVSGFPALPALPEKIRSKPGAVDNSKNCGQLVEGVSVPALGLEAQAGPTPPIVETEDQRRLREAIERRRSEAAERNFV